MFVYFCRWSLSFVSRRRERPGPLRTMAPGGPVVRGWWIGLVDSPLHRARTAGDDCSALSPPPWWCGAADRGCSPSAATGRASTRTSQDDRRHRHRRVAAPPPTSRRSLVLFQPPSPTGMIHERVHTVMFAACRRILGTIILDLELDSCARSTCHAFFADPLGCDTHTDRQTHRGGYRGAHCKPPKIRSLRSLRPSTSPPGRV